MPGGGAARRARRRLGAPFALFLNADAGALEMDLPGPAARRADAVMEITESALTERPRRSCAR